MSRLAEIVLRSSSLALTTALAACAAPDAGGPRPAPRVEHVGAMKAMFESGSAQGRVALAPLLGLQHVYALGPLEGLRGEILVWDGTPFTSRVEGGGVRVVVDPQAKAPFLVWSAVHEWREVAVPDDARTLAELEKWLPAAARDAKLDATKPFAFLLLGAAEQATIHVDDFPADGTPLTHAAHDAAQKRFELANVAVQILGFHATDAKGIYTHHDTNLHLHLRTQLGTTMGHVEQLTLAPGATLKLAWR